MAKKFANSKSFEAFEDIEQLSREKASIDMIKLIDSTDLVNYINNDEDIEDTADLELSIEELGFIDPIEVTDYNMKKGKYVILSGHRRRNAGVKQGYTSFPCIVKSFNTDKEVENYVLMANSQRDSSKDVLLIANRYRKHKDYLFSVGKTTDFRDEIAKRLNLSPKQADRYYRLLSVIPEALHLIRTERAGMSSIVKMSTYSNESQYEILHMMLDYEKDGMQLTREMCDKILSAYNKGVKNYDEMKKSINKDDAGHTENDCNDTSDIKNSGEKLDKDDIGNEIGDIKTGDNEVKTNDFKEDDNSVLEEVKQKNKKGLNINKNLETLGVNFSEPYSFDSEKTAVSAMQAIQSMIKIMLYELDKIGKNYNNTELLNKGLSELLKEIEGLMTNN